MTSRAPEQLYRVHWLSETGGTGSTALDKDGKVQPAVSKEEAEKWANYWNRVTRAGTKGINILDTVTFLAQNFLAVTGIFAIFLLLCLCGCATRTKTDYGSGISTAAILTKLPLAEARWLSISVPKSAHTSAYSDSLRQKGRSLPMWNWPFHPTTSQLKSSFRTRLLLPLIWSLVCLLFLNSSTGKAEITNSSSAGNLSTADRRVSKRFSNIKPKPAFRRVFLRALALEQMQGKNSVRREWSLLEIMNEFDLISLWDILDRIDSTEENFKQQRELGAEVDDDDIKHALNVITEAHAYCAQEAFHDADEVVQRTVYGFEFETRDFSTMAAELRHVRDALYDELRKRTFIAIAEDRRLYVNDVERLGLGVADAFSSARQDIYEACNCFAVECNTAAVFHLMRAVEWGLRALCVDLGLRRATKRTKAGKNKYTPISYVDWETMLNQLHDRVDYKISKLKRGREKQAAQEFYYPALQDIRAIRDAWRNHVMHTRAHYDRRDAAAIMGHVQRLMTLLATRIKEQ